MNKKQKMMTADEVNTQVKAAITEINSKEFPRMRPATVMCDLVQAVDGTSVTTNDQQEIEKVHITNEDIERLRKLFPPPRNLEKFEWAVEALEKSREMMQTDADEEQKREDDSEYAAAKEDEEIAGAAAAAEAKAAGGGSDRKADKAAAKAKN